MKNRYLTLITPLFVILILNFHSIKLPAQIQKKEIFDFITIWATLEKDTAVKSDSIRLCVNLINVSDSALKIYPEWYLFIHHKEDINEGIFISYDNPDRARYALNKKSNLDKSIVLYPQDTSKVSFKVKIDENFFYRGNNLLYVVYHHPDSNGNLPFISNSFPLYVEY